MLLFCHHAIRMCCNRFLCHPDQTRCRRIHLKAALSATSTLRTVYRDYSVSDFCTAKVGATVNLSINDNTATIDISAIIKYGFKIHEVSTNLQRKVKSTIENMTGLEVSDVNVAIAGVNMEQTK